MKIECACGHLISDSTDDLPHKAHVIPDQSWNALFETIDDIIENRCATRAQRAAACTLIRSAVAKVTRQAWQCRACGKLYVDGGGRGPRPIAFAPLDPGPPGEPLDTLFRT
jgi:hypothetical protein